MLSYIQGELISTQPGGGSILPDRQGVGYFVLDPSLGQMEVGQRVVRHLWSVPSQDGQVRLYGFPEYTQLRLAMVISETPSVGPATASALVWQLGLHAADLIASGDHKALAQCRGVGPKTAQNIVRAVKDQVVSLGLSKGEVKADELVKAQATLQALGHDPAVLERVDTRGLSASEIVRLALQVYGESS